MREETPVDFSAGDSVIDDLNALEQAIIEICDVETAQAIHARKRMIRKK